MGGKVNPRRGFQKRSRSSFFSDLRSYARRSLLQLHAAALSHERPITDRQNPLKNGHCCAYATLPCVWDSLRRSSPFTIVHFMEMHSVFPDISLELIAPIMKPALIALLCSLAMASVAAMEAEPRPKLLSERLYNPEQTYRSGGWHDRGTGDAKIWQKVLFSLGIHEVKMASNRYLVDDCRFDTALKVLNGIRAQLGAGSAYERVWAANQQKVLAACLDTNRENSSPPAMPTGPGLPARAESDFQYQLASWNFYNNDHHAALELYEQVEANAAAPLRTYAAYMVARCLARLGQGEEAYDKVARIETDPAFASVHDIASNYRFVLMHPTYSVAVTPALAKRHLAWLLKQATVRPEGAVNPQQAIDVYLDAMEQLRAYFPRSREDGVVDWWLGDEAPGSPRMQAVQELARTNELADWMQADWATNQFDSDWLGALHAKGDPYWQQNRRIVTHAWGLWKKGRNGSWLEIAIRRVHPQDPLAAEIRDAASSYLSADWPKETREFRLWLLQLWKHSVRIQLGRNEQDAALALITDHRELATSSGDYASYGFAQRFQDSHASILDSAIRYLVYTGQADQAKRFLHAAQTLYPRKYTAWESLLASSMAEALAPARVVQFERPSEYDMRVWRELVNELPTKALYELAASKELSIQHRSLLSRTVLTRAILLGMDDATINQYAKLAADANPPLRESILAGVSQHERRDYIRMLLTIPRMRPIPYLEYAHPESHYPRQEENPRQIDTLNPNDNNWWCKVDSRWLDNRVFAAARITPGMNGPKTDVQDEFEPYFAKQQAMLEKHPYRQLIDRKEMAALESIPSAPQFLTEAVIRQEKIDLFKVWQSSEAHDQRAADLHRALRTTRYGCRRNGSHAAYSRQAYALLQRLHGDSAWAKASPYWFR